MHDKLPLAASAAIDVVVVDEFHWVKRRVKVQPMKYNATNIARMAKARSIRDSRFMA
jgi:hypothetical protein